MTALVKDWLVTPHDLAINRDEIYVSGNLDKRIAAVSFDGRLLRYYTVEINSEFDNVSVGVTSTGRVLAMSSRGLWELEANGVTKKLFDFHNRIKHMIVGPDDAVYVSWSSRGRSTISRLGLDGATTHIVNVESDRISDLEFDREGNLFLADAQRGYILKYTPGGGLEKFAEGFTDPTGGGPFYLAFDETGRLYTSSARNELALVSSDGKITSLRFHVTGDLVFQGSLVYALDIYTSMLFKLDVSGTTLRSKEVILEGTTPGYIAHQNDAIVGERKDFRGRQFYNYYLDKPGRIETNEMLNVLKPDQYVFGREGMYLLFGNVLTKFSSAGREESKITLPGRFEWDTRLYYSPLDEKLFYYDPVSNAIIRTSMIETETFYRLRSEPRRGRVTVAATPEGNIFAAIVSVEDASILDITNPEQEKVVWRSPKPLGLLLIASDNESNLFAVMGAAFREVYRIDLSGGIGVLVSIVPESASANNIGFVDTHSFAVADSGAVIVSAPGVLIKFERE